jgi:uroporphyrinogen decarboxylase
MNTGRGIKMYSSRERIVAALDHKEPDRIPIAFGGLHDSIHWIGHRKLKKHFDLDGGEDIIQDPFQQIVFPDNRLMDILHSDIQPVYAKPPDFYKFEYKDEGDIRTYTDEWGTKYKQPKKGGLYFDFAKHILSGMSAKEIRKYPFPDPEEPSRFSGLREKVQRLNTDTDKAIIAYSPTGGVYEHTYWLRGIEESFIDMASNLKALEVLTEKILEWMLRFWAAYMKEIGDLIQVVQVGDDLGGQHGPLFSPDIYRTIYKPKEKKLISLIKKNTDAKIYFHSCGSIYEYLPDLIEIGVEVLNPVQVHAANMGSDKLKKEFGNDLSFWGGGADPVSIMSNGTVRDVEDEVKRRIDDFSPGGGFVFASIHNIQADVPPENVAKFFETAYRYGVY